MLATQVLANQTVAVPNGLVRLTYVGNLTPTAFKGLYYTIYLARNDPTATVIGPKSVIARNLLPDSARVLNSRHYEDVVAAFEQATKIQIEVRFTDPRNNRLLRRDIIPVLYKFSQDKEQGTVTVRLHPEFAEYLRIAGSLPRKEEGIAIIVLKHLCRLESIAQCRVYAMASSFANLSSAEARRVTYRNFRRTMGWTGAYYDEARRVREKLTVIFREIERITGKSFRIESHDDSSMVIARVPRNYHVMRAIERGTTTEADLLWIPDERVRARKKKTEKAAPASDAGWRPKLARYTKGADAGQ